jgi:hypothetical protein
LRAEGFSCNFDIIYGGLGISKLHFSAVNFSNFWSSKPWIRIGIQPTMLDPNPDSMNPDQKHCLQEHFALDSTESDGQEAGMVLEIESDDEEEVAIVAEEEQVVVDPIQELDNLFNSSHEVSWSALSFNQGEAVR